MPHIPGLVNPIYNPAFMKGTVAGTCPATIVAMERVNLHVELLTGVT